LKDTTIVAIVGLVCAAGLGIACVLKGIDSAIIASVAVSIGTIVGYAFGVRKK